MTTAASFSVGNYLIDSNQVYSIFKISDDRLYYQPAVSGGNHPSVTGSIPVDNVALAGFRPLLTASEIRDFFAQLKKAKRPTEPIDSKQFKDLVIGNDPFSIIPLLKQLWHAKHEPETNFSGTSRDTLEDIISHLTLEISLSSKKPPEQIRKKITTTLGAKSSPASTKN